jgi:flagellar biosynthesis/type III secretory pathway protein FliH
VLIVESEKPDAKSAAARIEAFRYPACAGAPRREWKGFDEVDGQGAAADALGDDDSELDGRPVDESHRLFQAGLERGREEGRTMEREAQAAAIHNEDERRKRQYAKLVADFSAERDRYLHAVEQEVVKLALAVAARILRREAQMDPLLLLGAVRVALGQLAAGSEVRLRVPAGELDLWKEALALAPNLALRPAVEAGDGMRLGECVIESKAGGVDLGVRSQLGEIERGFFDRAGGYESMNRESAADRESAAQGGAPA